MRSLKILVAEDDDQNQAIMKLILNRQGHNVECVWNGLEAVEAVKTSNFDLVFMDVHMPEMNGVEATKQIRLWENNQKHTPIVILTGSVSHDVTSEYKQAGADTYIFKPFDIKRISKLIDIFVAESEEVEISGSGQISEISPDQQPVLDISDALPRFGNNEEQYFSNLTEFLISVPERLDKIDQSMQSQDWNNLNLAAHNLKGVAANYGAKQLAAFASLLEKHSQQEQKTPCSDSVRKIHHSANAFQELAVKALEQYRSENPNPSGGL